MNAVRTNTAKALKIILVDDDEEDRMLFADVIQKSDVHVELTLLSDGQKLLDALKNKSTSPPDLIFLDLNMPVMDGGQCLRILRENPEYDDINIAIYSTSKCQKHVEQTFIDGANIFITKPHTIQKLSQVIKKVLSLNWQYHTSNLNRENFIFYI